MLAALDGYYIEPPELDPHHDAQGVGRSARVIHSVPFSEVHAVVVAEARGLEEAA